jgi:hypothetical protein
VGSGNIGLEHRVSALLAYLERKGSAGPLRPSHACSVARRRNGEPISTAFVESAVNEIIAKRVNKKQQMRRSRAPVQPFLDVRTAVLNEIRSKPPSVVAIPASALQTAMK